MSLSSLLDFSTHRLLQFELPDYTSPPLEDALEATPEAFRNDTVIETMRMKDAAGNCTFEDCHIPFEASADTDEFEKMGVVLYGGGLVDPRGYSVLAEPLAEMGLTTVVPVFENDLAFGVPCGSGRVEWAQEAFPSIEKWILVGHSFGGVAAMSDAWLQLEKGSDSVAGVVLLAADVQPEVCGPSQDIDFSETDFPMGAVTATEDGVLNSTRWEENVVYLSNNTIFESIEGGNHGQFGSYNYTLRLPLLGQTDGVATISPQEQWDASIDVVLQVAMMAMDGDVGDSPTVAPETTMPTAGAASSYACVWRVGLMLASLYAMS